MAELSLPLPVIVALFTMVAFFYASVGLGGGSAYTAMLAVFGAGVATIPMVALTLNVLVTTLGSLLFLWRKHARLRLIAPFLITSIPMAYVGGMLDLPKIAFYSVLFVSLILAALRIYLPVETAAFDLGAKGRLLLAFVCGALLGLIAGIAGIGGGVYLVPLILFLGLGTAKEAAACGAFFVWVNSMSGLAARVIHNRVDLLPYMPIIFGVVAGGFLGAFLGAGYFKARTMEKFLGLILVVAVVFLGKKILSLL